MDKIAALFCGCTKDWLCKEALRLWTKQADLYLEIAAGGNITHTYIAAKSDYTDHREGRRFSSPEQLKEKYKGYNNREHVRVTREILELKEDDGTDQ